MQAIQEAKKKLFINIGSNIVAVIVNALFAIWLTPYLIKHMGVEAYGMVPLFASVVGYFGLFTMAITSTISRFVAIHLGAGEIEQGNIYFNTGLFTLLALCGMLLVPLVIITILVPKIFQIPEGFENDAKFLFFCVVISSFIATISSPYFVSTFVTHRFYLRNLATIIAKIVQLLIIVLGFSYLSVSLKCVGFSYIGLTGFLLLCSILLTIRLTPELKVQRNFFRLGAIRDLSGMGTWVVIDQLGTLLYLNIELFVINRFLGPEPAGLYAPIVLWVILLRTLGAAIANVFAPVAFDYIARKQLQELIRQLKRVTKFVGLTMALPIGLLCGLSEPLLERWLGPSFTTLSPLVWFLVAPQVIHRSVSPMPHINRGMNKVRAPAIVRLIGGGMNLALGIILVTRTNLGMYGMALSTVICALANTLIFLPHYSAILLKCPLTTFSREILWSLAAFAPTSALAWYISNSFHLASISRLVLAGGIISIIYVLFCYMFLFTKDDRKFLLSLIKKVK